MFFLQDLFKDFPPIDLTKIDYNNSYYITIIVTIVIMN